jgi:hypothetical protein
LLTLLYPLFHMAGPTYNWVVNRRVYRWYRVLQRIEEKTDAAGDAASLHKIHEELERTGDQTRNTHVPASYRANLFALRVHHQPLVDRLNKSS